MSREMLAERNSLIFAMCSTTHSRTELLEGGLSYNQFVLLLKFHFLCFPKENYVRAFVPSLFGW